MALSETSSETSVEMLLPIETPLTIPEDLEHDANQERPAFYPGSEPLETSPPTKVIIVGAGLAGLITTILLSHKVRNLSYTIIEKNDKVGGTWATNTYPGVRCDVPSHCYQTTFSPNPSWSEYYSRGSEICEYYQGLAEKFNVLEHVQFRHEVLEAAWDAKQNEWVVKVADLTTGNLTFERAPFFINAQGRLSKPEMPKIPGLTDKFNGKIIHTAEWDGSYDMTGKRIAIVGNGASGQQILPNLLGKVSHVDHYVRSKVWVTPMFTKGLVQATGGNPGGYQYTDEDKKQFAEDPEHYLAYRREIESSLHDKFQRTVLGSEDNEKLREACVATMSQRLGGDEVWLKKLVPDFAPGCKRLTPAPGYLEALQDPRVTYVQDPITHVTEKGVVTADGSEREVDVIIAATGFDNGFVPFFPTIGLSKRDLSKLWAVGGDVGYPETYFGVMAPEMPNYFFVLQAQSNGGGGSIPLQCEISATYIAKVIRKSQRESLKSITPSRAAVDDFNDLCLGYFEDKVVSDTCSSWLKTRGPKPRNLVWWPGSGHHRFDICRDPRWEDFDYTRDRGGRATGNRYAYFGSGWTARERDEGKEALTRYLRAHDNVDIALMHEYWNE